MENLYSNYQISQLMNNVKCEISFKPFLRYFKDIQNVSNTYQKSIYDYIVDNFESKFSAFLDSYCEFKTLNENSAFIELLQMSILPASINHDHELIGFGTIFPNNFFFRTPSFEDIILPENEGLMVKETKNGLDNLRAYYALILGKCYGIKTEFNSFKVIGHDCDDNTYKFYKIKTDTRFIQVNPIDILPPAKEEWDSILYGNDNDLIRLTEQLPASLFKIEGFAIFYAHDITFYESMNQLKNIVLDLNLNSEERSLDEMEKVMGILVGDTNLKIGVVPFFRVNNEIVTNTSYFQKTILISTLEQFPNELINPRTAEERFKTSSEPFIFSKVDRKSLAEEAMLEGLHFLNIDSYMVIPVRNSLGEILGILELGSEKENFLSRKLIPRIEPALGLISEMLAIMINRFDEKIKTVIKERFTSLQPSVEWKFNESAWQFISSKSDQESQLPNVVFEDVYPLHGSIDIRNSSVERNKVTLTDMVTQLKATQNLISSICTKIDLPLLEGFSYKSERYIHEIEDSFTAEIEKKIIDFFNFDIYATFIQVAEQYDEFSIEINSYLEKTNPKTGDFHLNMREYENSLQTINLTISEFLEIERTKQNNIYPHYFEKYRTDGVEYTLYTGQSLNPAKKFNNLYLKNLRLWQLISMAYIGNLTKNILPEIAIPLQTTQLILGHYQPITISFRKDEHRFDVEGSYNIRYEVMKKRIDKIRIKSTDERLTKPDCVAIIYTQTNESEEYRNHLTFLINKGIYEPDFEELELEDMAGVNGLKAFRATINYDFFKAE